MLITVLPIAAKVIGAGCTVVGAAVVGSRVGSVVGGVLGRKPNNPAEVKVEETKVEEPTKVEPEKVEEPTKVEPEKIKETAKETTKVKETAVA